MFDGPWYECQGPSKDEALNLLNSHSRIKEIYIPEWCLEKIIQKEFDKYDGLGSWRGFHTFTLTTLVNNTFKWYETKYLPAMKILTTSKYLKNWVNHLLYRYPESNSNQNIGLRVHFHEENFNKISIQSN
jgi:hypothetical protein